MPDPSDFTPVFKQWHAAKQQYPDVLLLFRMGDFYEMFGEDAEVAARERGAHARPHADEQADDLSRRARSDRAGHTSSC